MEPAEVRKPGDDPEMRAFSVATVASQRGISDSHLRDLIREGQGPGIIRLGRRIVITVQALREWDRKLQGINKSAA